MDNIQRQLVAKLLKRYESRPATRTGADLAKQRWHLRQGVAAAKLEGFEPTADDNRSFELLASGRITAAEYEDLALTIVRAQGPGYSHLLRVSADAQIEEVLSFARAA
jgi:hypothetical protein